MTAGIQCPPDISIAGFRSDQKLAAIMTPAAKPSIVSKTQSLMVLKKSTKLEPTAVMNQVKSVP